MWFDEMNVFEQYLVSIVGTIIFGIGHCIVPVDDLPMMIMMLSAMGLSFGLVYRFLITSNIKPKDKTIPTAPEKTEIFNFDSAIAEGKIVAYNAGQKRVYQINRDDFPVATLAFISVMHEGEKVLGVYVPDQTTSHIYTQYLFTSKNAQQFVLRIFLKQRPLLKLVS